MKLIVVAICFCLTGPAMLVAAERVPWTSSRVVGSPDPPKPYHVQPAYPHLSFDQPVELMPLGDTGKMMLLEVGGKLYTFDDDPECRHADLAIDVQPLIGNFRRAFGFGVHPDFARTRQVFLVYSGNPVARPEGARLSRFTVSMDQPPRIDPESEEILLTWHSGGHNGSAIRFDSQGLLYFSAGDGSRPYPPDEYNVSQDLSDLRSSICRIDVDRRDGDRPYSIPSDNPFLGVPGARPEIWAYGFRNPWRFTIVPETDQVLCGDVGWELWELIFDVHRGSNCGWSLFEGPQPIRSDIEPGPTKIEKPLVAYPHTIGQSVTGGIVYQGKQHTDLAGAYLYGDFVTGLLWGLRLSSERLTWNPTLAETGLQIISIAESRQGEALIVDFAGGIYKLVKNEAVESESPFPRKLSETGLFTSTKSMEPAPGVIQYEITARSSQEGGATSEFVLGVPGTGTIRINRRQRSWIYPKGTVFANTLSKDSRKLETQILHFNGIDWQPYSYVWNDTETDAHLVDEAGVAKEYAAVGEGSEALTWRIPNRAQCRACHSRQNGGAVGFTLENLDRDGQIDRFIELGILDRRAPPPWRVASMVDPHDDKADLEKRARSYLAANCAHCHQRGGGGTVPMDLSYSVARDEINAVDVVPSQGDFGIKNAKVIDPGDPYRSILFYRMATNGTGHMPKLWTRDNDRTGLRLVHDWITSLGESPADGLSPSESIDLAESREDTAESLKLFASLLFGDPVGPDREDVLQQAVDRGNVAQAALFERFLPADKRRKRLGNDIDPAQILALPGDVRRGRELFHGGQLGQCTNCHRLQGSGRSVGPDLDSIAKTRTREQLLESILDPSKVIEAPFQSYLVLTDDGSVITGLKIQETAAVVVIRTPDGKDTPIRKLEIETLKSQNQSLMPTGLAAEMTAQELADLLAFLGTLK